MYGFYVHKFKSQRDVRRKFLKYSVISWFSPLIPSILGLYFDGYGPSALYCWIKSQELVLIIALLYAPMGILVILLIYFYARIVFSLRHQSSDSETRAMLFELLFYPIGVILNYLISAFDRFLNIGLGWNWVWFAYFHLFVKQAQGFVNALVYGGSSKVRKAIKASIKNRKRIPEEDAFYFKPHVPGDLSSSLIYSSNNTSAYSLKSLQLS